MKQYIQVGHAAYEISLHGAAVADHLQAQSNGLPVNIQYSDVFGVPVDAVKSWLHNLQVMNAITYEDGANSSTFRLLSVNPFEIYQTL